MAFSLTKATAAFSDLPGRALRLLYGYDIFISYTRADSRDYAMKLYEQLTSLDYSCFIDRKEVPAASPLNSSLLSALKSSKTYILVGTETALKRDYVKLEFEEFAKTFRPLIPISIGGALLKGGALSQEPWKVIKERDIVWLDETAEAVEKGLPSPEVYEGIQTYFSFTRRNVKRRRLASAVALVIIVASLAAVWQGVVAAQRLNTLNAEIERAQRQKEDYDRQIGEVKTQLETANNDLTQTKSSLETANNDLANTKTALGVAEAETDKANLRRDAAEANAHKAELREKAANAKADKAERRAKANATVLAADSSPDPLTSLLLLTELPKDDEPADGMRVAQRLASTIIPHAVERGHTARLTSVAFSPDQKRVLTASADGTARVWAEDGRGDPVVLSGHKGEITAAVFNADGSLVATASKDGTARLWDARAGNALRVFTQDDAVNGVQFTSDGNWLVTTAEKGDAKLWRSDGTGALTLALPEHRRAVRVWLEASRVGGISAAGDGTTWRFALGAGGGLTFEPLTRIPEAQRVDFPDDGLDKIFFSRDGSHLAIVFQQYVLVQSVGGGEVHELTHGGSVDSVDFDADGSHIVTASSDGEVRVWDTKDGKVSLRIDTGIRFYEIDLYREQSGAQGPSLLGTSNVVFTHDGTRVLTFSDDGVLRLWNVKDGGRPTELRGHAGAEVAAFSTDDGELVTGADDGTARVWSLSPFTEPLVLNHPKPVYMSSFSPDGASVLTAGGDGVARVWPLKGGHPLELDAHAGKVSTATFDRAGAYVLTSHDDGAARLWKLDDPGKPVKEFVGGGKKLAGAQFSPDETRVLVWSEDGVVKIWPRQGDGVPVTLDGPKVQVWQAQFSVDGSRVVTAYDDGTARVWSADGSGRYVLLAGDKGHKGTVYGAAFSPDGSRVVTVSKDGTAKIWRSDGHGDPITLAGAAPDKDELDGCAFSPDGTKVVTTSAAGRVWVWPANGLSQPLILRRTHDLAHIGLVSNVAFSPDGQRLVTSGSYDGIACIWHVNGGKPVVLQGHGGTVTYASFSADGSRIVTASEDGTARVWRTSWADILSYLRFSTTATLTPEQRITLLEETEQNARKIYEQKEQAYGRTPLSPEWKFSYPF